MALILHTVLAVAVLAAYCALTITGHDGTALLGVLVGQGAAGGIQVATK